MFLFNQQMIRISLSNLATLLILSIYIDFVKGWCLKNTIQQSDKVYSVDYSPDGTMIATGMLNGDVHVYDALSMTLKFNLVYVATKQVNWVKFNHLSTVLVAGGKDGTISIYNLLAANPQTSVTVLASATVNQGDIYVLDFNIDSTWMLSCGNSNNMKVWPVPSYTSPKVIPTNGPLYGCQFTFDNNIVIADQQIGKVLTFPNYLTSSSTNITYGSGNTAYLSTKWNSATWEYIVGGNTNSRGYYSPSTTSIYGGSQTLATAFARTGQYFLFTGNDKTLTIYNASTKTVAQSIIQAGTTRCTDFSNDGRYLVSGDDSKFLYLYDSICTISCDSTYFYNTTSKVCQLCSSMQGCGTCYSGTVCAVCIGGYYLNSGKTCTACHITMAGCAVCGNATNCTAPLPGYYINTTWNATTCQSTIPGCLICNSTPGSATVSCLQCHNQYYLDTASPPKCVSCTGIANCLKCFNSTYCTQCQMGFYPIYTSSNTVGTCWRCTLGTSAISNCLDCKVISGTNTCFQCAIGYYASGTACTACSANCLACNNTGNCTDCATNTYLTGTGTCVACTSPCMMCNTSASTCLSCIPGYYWDGTSSCIQCIYGCQTCRSSSNCTTCIQGYAYDSTNFNCTRCMNKFPNCQTCNSTNCSICQSGFYYNSTFPADPCKSCSEQVHGCVLCNSSTTCIFCAVGHYLHTNNTCQPCSLGCATCQTSANCTSCVPGYYYNSVANTCPVCTGLCTTCSVAPGNCTSCVIGYYLSAVGVCSTCNSSITDCLSCYYDSTPALKCTQCGVGYYLASGTCTRCINNCTTCSSPTTCLSCPLTFYLHTDNTCKTCTPTCAQCSASGTCQSCNVGYYLAANASCIACTDIGCLTCNNIPKCLSCIAGYTYISSNLTCQLCSITLANCLFCSNTTNCTQCTYGYALVTSGTNKVCSTCSILTGCFHCSDISTCLACQSGYYLTTPTCTPCPQGCITCQNGTYCLSCGTSYYLGTAADAGKCLRCQQYLPGCDICSNSSSCVDCLGGYYQKTVSTNIQCQLCQLSIPYCSLCNTSTICSSCKGGYYLASDFLSCKQCSINFTACRLCNRLGTACTDCQTGYYLDTGSCLMCSNNLPGCQICSNAATCLECGSGYFLNTPNCQLCATVMPGCIFCQSNIKCLQCQGGYYLDSTFKCIPCASIGCQICVQSSPADCVTCNSLYYKSSTTTCSSCRSALPGCLTCTSSTACTKCDVGYYVTTATPTQCLLCSNTMQGCSICSSSTMCIQCKSMYFLNSTNKCQICSQPLTGCTFCTNNTVCIACGSGYFKNTSNLCQSCTDLVGCLVCKDGSTCLFCDTGYYFNAYSCLSCDVISGCYSCISSAVCTSCVGGYTLNTNGGCDVTQVKADQKVTEVVLKTFYQDIDTLKHYLYTKGMTFKKVTLDWAAQLRLFITHKNGTQVNLVIKTVEWSQENDYTLIIYTNNPINYDQSSKSMPFARRLLTSSLDLSNTKTGIQISDTAAKQLLPDLLHTGSLLINYKLDNPEFYSSYVRLKQSNFPFYVIGAVISGVLFIMFLFKALATVPKSYNLGNIIPHILAFKVGALLLYPTYLEYISYCSGFMFADFPWLNRFFGDKMSDARDQSPASYKIFFVNMNIASMYLLALSILALLIIIGLLVGKSFGKKYQHKMNAFFTFLYNFFVFGVIFAGCASLQGAINNPITSLSLNATFYILGILLYFGVVCECVYKISQDKSLYFWRIRIFIKATLLSLSHQSPIYLLASTVVVDLILVFIEYRLNVYPKQYPKCWIFANVMCNLALVLLVFLPIIQLTMVLVSVSLFGIIVAQAIMHYLETRLNTVVSKLQQVSENDDRNVWDLNFDQKAQSKIQETKQNFYDASKNGFLDNDKLKTMYKEEPNQKQEVEDLQTLEVSKYKRQRNYKKARQENKQKLRVENTQGGRNNLSSTRFKDSKEQNLTFMIEDVADKD